MTKVTLFLTLDLFDDLHNEHKDQSSHIWSSDRAAVMQCANKFLLQILIHLFQLAHFTLNPADFREFCNISIVISMLDISLSKFIIYQNKIIN